jgi:hypothetical protein
VAKSKSVVVTFRVDAHLAEALERLPDKSAFMPDKSAFIRKALTTTFHETCPACAGEGRLDCDAAKWLGGVLVKEGAKKCKCCGTAFPPKLGSGGATATTCGHCGPDGHRH